MSEVPNSKGSTAKCACAIPLRVLGKFQPEEL